MCNRNHAPQTSLFCAVTSIIMGLLFPSAALPRGGCTSVLVAQTDWVVVLSLQAMQLEAAVSFPARGDTSSEACFGFFGCVHTATHTLVKQPHPIRSFAIDVPIISNSSCTFSPVLALVSTNRQLLRRANARPSCNHQGRREMSYRRLWRHTTNAPLPRSLATGRGRTCWRQLQ